MNQKELGQIAYFWAAIFLSAGAIVFHAVWTWATGPT